MVKTYILAPNWSTAPPPDGPIKLGHILDNLTEFVPVNRIKIVEIPKEWMNPLDTKTGFTTSRSKLISGELGFAAKVIGLMGVGVGADIYYKKNKNDVLSCQKLITMTFDPTDDYIADSMKLPEVQRFMRGCNFKSPVFMVTGLKISRGSALRSSHSTDKGVRMEGGIAPLGSPVQLEGKAGIQSVTKEDESWDASSPFIVAFRVRKIWYRHGDEYGDIKNKAHKEKVVMQDGAVVRSESALVLAVDDEVAPSDVSESIDLTVDKEVEDGEEVRWVIPKVDSELATES
ncbi:hypothetical protein HIM_09770 [Hirsutella minnesotensis 3608]|uniref:Uncharacterized protein n=1 Tax=Hirsutella minnesotensis 3608 TaxID=1043627 RepID=A0A0F7ZGG6_9HYPO|nr:hypothetical protein HIM_09770 [Hirsutella minnesotensis 3608]